MRQSAIILALNFCAAIASAAEPAKPWHFDAAKLKPFWLSGTMEGESVLFMVERTGAKPKAALLFEPAGIVSVCSSSGEVTYAEGRDYVWKPGAREISLPPGSRIVFRSPEDLRRPAGSQPHRLTHRDGRGEIFFGGGHEYHDMQTLVTYTHKPRTWPGDLPSFAGDRLPRTLRKLEAKEPLRITLLGDSISTGCNASGWAKVAPLQPPYQDLLVLNLEAAYGGKVSLKNFAVSGTDTAWGLREIGKVIESKPDLVILAFGMNDSAGRPAAQYQANIQGMVDAVRKTHPAAEFILVATMLGNKDWTLLNQDLFPQYRDALARLCGPGIVLADMTSLWTEMLKHKRDWDMTGNGVNHPNDFGHRVYAQVLSALMIGGILSAAGAVAQPPGASAPPAAESREYLAAPSIPYGSRISRTMRLLATSTPQHKHRVRILFYGQSITGGWTDIVLKDLQHRFPNADIAAENHALGGFSAPWLSQTAEADLYPWYPDLLFLQDYGALDPAMERMYAAIRSRTTADVLTFTHHFDAGSKTNGEDDKNTHESAKIRELSEKYGYEVVDIRPSWQKYLALHHIDRKELLGDVVHLEPNGIALMASMVVPHLRYDPERHPAGPDRVRYYDAKGSLLNGSFDNAPDVLPPRPFRFEFEGNRVDVAAAADGKFGTARILIDGKKPSAFRGMYAATRTNPAPGSWFPALRCVELGEGVVPEDWELTITRINDKCTEFEYEVTGSVTGPDGKGSSKEKFTSTSGRLIIEPDTFCFDAAHQIFKKPVPIGFKVAWRVYGTSLDEWKPRKIADPAKENLSTLAQGLPNGKHVLEILPNGDGDLPVRYLVVYQPLAASARATEDAKALLNQAGVKKGLCLHVGCGQAGSEGLTADLAASSGMLVHGLALDAAACDRVRTSIRKRGVQGQAQVEKLTARSLPYVADLADLVVVENPAALRLAGIDAAELNRVLAPGGVLLEKSGGQWKRTVKPFHQARPWTHPMGGPDGNRVAAEPVIFPVGVRWQDGLPLNIVHWASARSYVAASGRVFSISMTESENLLTNPNNHQAKQQWLTARSSASGLPLWKLPLGNEDPMSDLNTLNTLPLATDGEVVLVAKEKGLIAVNAADGAVTRTFPVAFPTNRLVFLNGIAVAAGWEAIGRKAMWDPASKPESSLWDIRFGGTGHGAVEAFEAATAKLLWKDPVAAQQVLATDDTVIYLAQGVYPVKEQAIVARELRTGRLRWRTTHADLAGNADLFLMCVGKNSVVLGRHKTGSTGAGVGCKQIVVLSLGDGKKRWEAMSDGGPMALVVGDEIWFGSKRFAPGSGKILGGSPIPITSGMCVPPMLLGDVGGTPRGGDWTDVKTGQRYRSGGVRGSCVQGAASTDGKMYIAQNWCRCAPGQVPGFVALGHADLPTEEAFHAPRPVESVAAAPVPPANSPAGAAAEWPTFRGNADRSGACTSVAPTALPIKWRVSAIPDKATPLAAVWHDALAPRLSAPVVAHHTVYVAACCEGEVVALDLATGREIWREATGSRIDSPPTVHGGLCLAGSHDGYLYAFAYDTGKLVWRTRVAPEERRVVAFGQVESAWPVVGSPLVAGNVGYAIAGRSTEMDGGCAVLAFDPATGATRWATRALATPGRRCDTLAWRDNTIAMQRWSFDPASGTMQATNHQENPDQNLDGLIDGTWTWLGTRRGGKFPVGKLTADVVVWNGATYFACGPGRKVFAIDRAAAEQADPKRPNFAWTWACPERRQIEAMALAADSLVAAGRVWDSDPRKMQGFLTLLGKEDGTPGAETLLPAAPVHHGVCVVPGRAIVCLENGSVACLGR